MAIMLGLQIEQPLVKRQTLNPQKFPNGDARYLVSHLYNARGCDKR
jgi:hypothetical protein